MKTIILSVVLLFFISCENPIEEPDYLQSIIYGTITDSDTGEPLDSVGISIYNIKVKGFNDLRYKKIGGTSSNELGQYKLAVTLEKDGFHRVGAYKSGYKRINYIISSKYPIAYEVFQQLNLQMEKI